MTKDNVDPPHTMSNASLSTFARSSLAQFVVLYAELTVDGNFIPASELETRMWAALCAKEYNVEKLNFRIPYDLIRKSKMHLPYLPEDIKYSGCCGIKKNGGLYTPCCGRIKDGDLCQTCAKAYESGDLTMLSERDESIEKGKFKPVTFGEYLRDHKLTLEDVYSALAEVGASIKIPAEELVMGPRAVKATRRRGRPTKDETDDEEEPKEKITLPKVKVTKKMELVESSDDESLPSISKVVAEPKPLLKKVEEKPKKEKELKKPVEELEAKSEPVEPPEEPKKEDKPKKKAKAESKEMSDSEEEPKKKAKAKEPKAKEPKEKKEKKPKEVKVEIKEELAVEPPEQEDLGDDCEIDGTEYTLRNGYIFSKDDGSLMGKVNEDGEVDWS